MADQEEQKPSSPKAPSPVEEPAEGNQQVTEEQPKTDDAGRQSKSPEATPVEVGDGAKSPVETEDSVDANQSAGGDESQEQTETEKEATEAGRSIFLFDCRVDNTACCNTVFC